MILLLPFISLSSSSSPVIISGPVMMVLMGAMSSSGGVTIIVDTRAFGGFTISAVGGLPMMGNSDISGVNGGVALSMLGDCT